MYGIHGDRLGGYAVAGIEITYVIKHHTYTADIYSGALLFYDPRHETPAQHRKNVTLYNALENRAATALQKMARGA